MPVAMFRQDSMALHELKDIPLEPCDRPSRWACQSIFSPVDAVSSPTDLCESSSDNYSSDGGCIDEDNELHNAIWTTGFDLCFSPSDGEHDDEAQIISPFSGDVEFLSLGTCELPNPNPNFWTIRRPELIEKCTSKSSDSMPSETINEDAECDAGNELHVVPRAVHGGKREYLSIQFIYFSLMRVHF